MIRQSTVFLVAMLMVAGSALAQSSLEGKVIDSETGEPILFGYIVLFKNGVQITGGTTDLDGNYSIPNLDPGTYDVQASYTGYQSQRQVGVVVLAGKAVRLDFELVSGLVLDEIEVVDYQVPLIEQDNTTTGGVVTAEKILNLPSKDINSIALTTAGLSAIDGEEISVRGSRANATDYYIDGVRVSGNLIPQSEIDQLQVVTGGIEAAYGDVTGGIISITTKGPSSKLSGALELESSEFLDPYGYNLISGNLSGPIIKNKQGRTVLGFRVSGQFISREDDKPGAFGWYRATEETISRLENDPITIFNTVPTNSAEFFDSDDVQRLDARPNIKNTQYDLTAKIDARLSDAIDVSFSGNYNRVESFFAPNEAWALYNWRNNPVNNIFGYRGNLRFRHRIGAMAYDPGAPPSAQQQGLIRNASYTLQFGYQKDFSELMSSRHGENLFNYGHVGSFVNEWTPGIGELEYSGSFPLIIPFTGDTLFLAHSGFSQNFQGWTPGDANPTLANYNNLQEDVAEMNQYNAFNGFWSDNFSSTWDGLHNNVGTVYNRYFKGESDRYTFQASSAFDLYPGGSENGRHNIQFGLIYEQRIVRRYDIAPRRLWEIARLQANGHIIGVDTNVVVGSIMDTIAGQAVEFEEFQTLISEDSDLLFYKKVRELTGQSIYEYVNVDEIDPNDLSLDLFSAQELNDQMVLGYYGYDYLGNKIATNATFNDFFTDFDEEGRRNFTVAPWKPIYSAAFIQDKFTFKDIIFRLGLRVDRYDANTQVLKDPLTLYPIMGANDFFSGPGSAEERPANVEDDWSVYVQTEGSTNVKAFRDGEQWYTAEGSPANDGNVIFGGEIVTPYYVEQDNRRRNIRSRDFDPSGTFEDYTPQVNWMPRLAFSFPISDEANFFAHYDILVQRPPSRAEATALDYYYFEDEPPRNNPNLKPEKTIDYEVGFQQKLSNSSAIKLSAYYKELRDMIQSRVYLYVPAPVNQYESFGNLDFGTVKGFSVAYDLRRTNNLELTANYTLQFADGTGSDVNSQRGLSDRGNLRTLFPLSFDERHAIVANIDYRYGSGRRYNGPRLFGADIFANAGVGIQMRAVSGRPYTRTQEAVQFDGVGFVGSFNGARLPFNYTVDLRANKMFRLNAGADFETTPIFVNVYLRVQNLFDTKNVIDVYSASGSAEDDGYLASPIGQSNVEGWETLGRNSDDYVTSYQWRLLDNGFYTLPRRIYLGAILQF